MNHCLKAITLIFIFSLVLFTPSCIVNKNENTSKQNGNYFQYQTIEIRSNTLYRDAFNEQSTNVLIRIEKDRTIWVSITGPLNIEGARLLIMPDSVALIDRINKVFYSGSYSAFATKYKINLQFSELQNMLTGSITIDQNKLPCTKGADDITCIEKKDSIVYTYIIHPKNYTLEQLRAKDRYSRRELSIKFASYTTLNGRLFSLQRNIELLSTNEMLQVQLDIQKVEFNKMLEFPFSVSETYRVAHF